MQGREFECAIVIAQALFSTFGYTYLDVRPSLELEEVGKVKGSVNIPLVNASRKYSSEKQKKVLQKEDNPNFVQDVRSLRSCTLCNCLYTNMASLY